MISLESQGPATKLRQPKGGQGWGHLSTCVCYLGVPYAFGSFLSRGVGEKSRVLILKILSQILVLGHFLR